jgi:hypothetical protein
MKSFKEYIVESQQWMETPADGDDFAIELEDGTLIETYIIEVADNCILLDATPDIVNAIAEWAALEDTDEGDSNVILESAVFETDPDAIDAAKLAAKADSEKQIGAITPIDTMDEAEYQGRKVPLGKPMRGDVKKFKVYVKDPATGNVKKVNFGHGGTSAKRLGQKTMKIKKSNPARRKSFRARHNCANPGPRTIARYWSCRAW